MPNVTTVLRRLAACGLAVLACMTTAQADETDWLYFPMYARDTAHAVDLRALSWRPDGLLASATRYPRYSGETWSEEESSRGWYNYERRLIDCNLGFYVTTDVQLLDGDGKVIASRSFKPQDWVESLQRQLADSQTKPWPQRDEILLACAAASDTGLKKHRAHSARTVQPLLSSKPIITDLAAESDALMGRARPHYVVNAPHQRPPATAETVFGRVRQQWAQWRQSVIGPAAATPSLAAPNGADIERQLSAYSQQATPSDIGSVRVLPGDVLEYVRPARFMELPELSPKDESRVVNMRRASVTIRVDCASGLALPMSVDWRDDDGKVLLTKPTSVIDATTAVQHAGDADSRDSTWDLRWGARGKATLAGQLCRTLTRLKANAAPADTPDDDAQAALLSRLTAERLAQESTPEAMLLAIRAVWRDSLP